MLIIMHCMTMYSGVNPSWQLPDSIEPVLEYTWIQRFTYAFLLEAFTFMSGYIYCYGMRKQNRSISLKYLLISKIKRLMIPSIVFSVIFSLLFHIELLLRYRVIYDVIMGVGHMWYLPTLFLCFSFTYLIKRIMPDDICIFTLLLSLALFSFVIPNYIRISQVCYYEFFFFLGFVTNKNDYRIKNTYCAFILLVFVVPMLLYVKYNYFTETSSFLVDFVECMSQITIGTVGSVSLYSICYNKSKMLSQNSFSFICRFSSYSMSIYLCQEFIIRILYYKTQTPQVLGTYWLPWISILITLIVSYFLAIAMHKNKFCKTLIGS